ncbi:MAG: DoxX family protein [Saprospiraceae bacterium]
MKKYKFSYWISTGLIFLFEGVMPALTGQSEMAKDGIRHLGYPDYFGLALVISKVLASTLLILPFVPPRIKEWAYAGLSFEFIFAMISLWATDGLSPMVLFPMVVLGVLMLSYFSYRKIQNKSWTV